MTGFIREWRGKLGRGVIVSPYGLFTFTRNDCSPRLLALLADFPAASPVRVKFEIAGTSQAVAIDIDLTQAPAGGGQVLGLYITDRFSERRHRRSGAGRKVRGDRHRARNPQGSIKAKKRTVWKSRAFATGRFTSKGRLDSKGGAVSKTANISKERKIKVYYATDRARTVSDGEVKYTSERTPKNTLEYGSCTVSIPPNHKVGHLESPSIYKLQFSENPKKHISLLSINKTSNAKFYEQVNNRVSKSEGRELFVFIHGYNVSFKDAARRTAQIAFDLNFDGAPIFYSWPSAARVTAYPKDATNVGWTIPHLRQFLLELSQQSGATTIHLIAHSMGNRALTDVLRSWGEQGEPKAAFRHVVLTAPDIDAETFKGLAQAMCSKAGKITVYTSHLDKALLASKKFNGYVRAGEEIVVVKGIDTIDASAVNTTFWGHSHFGESRSVIQDIYYLLKGLPPEKRHGITRQDCPDGFYYVFNP